MRRLLDELPESSSLADIGSDYGRQLIIERILSALVDLAAAINTHIVVATMGQAPPDMRSSFRMAAQRDVIDSTLAAKLSSSVGLRNVLVHAYVELDVAVLLEAVPLAREQYGTYVTQVARWVRSQDDAGVVR